MSVSLPIGIRCQKRYRNYITRFENKKSPSHCSIEWGFLLFSLCVRFVCTLFKTTVCLWFVFQINYKVFSLVNNASTHWIHWKNDKNVRPLEQHRRQRHRNRRAYRKEMQIAFHSIKWHLRQNFIEFELKAHKTRHSTQNILWRLHFLILVT